MDIVVCVVRSSLFNLY